MGQAKSPAILNLAPRLIRSVAIVVPPSNVPTTVVVELFGEGAEEFVMPRHVDSRTLHAAGGYLRVSMEPGDLAEAEGRTIEGGESAGPPPLRLAAGLDGG